MYLANDVEFSSGSCKTSQIEHDQPWWQLGEAVQWAQGLRTGLSGVGSGCCRVKRHQILLEDSVRSFLEKGGVLRSVYEELILPR